MCGISALFIHKKQKISLFNSIQEMTHIIRHCVPDDEVYVIFDDGMKAHFSGGKDTPEDVFNASTPSCPDRNYLSQETDLIALGHQPMTLCGKTVK